MWLGGALADMALVDNCSIEKLGQTYMGKYSSFKEVRYDAM
jgi:hypothetical protein